MSWLCRDAEILEDDLETLSFEPRECHGLVMERKDGETNINQEWLLTTKDDWLGWLDQVRRLPQEQGGSGRINLILGARGKGQWEHDASLVSKLPWSRDTFSHIKNQLLLHGSIVRAINRNTSCMFSRMEFNWNTGKSSERSLASWPKDMALSVTFLVDSLTTNAIFFGCDMEETDIYDQKMTMPSLIVSRLRNSDIPIYHPMLLPTVFADIERDRQIELVRDMLRQLGQRLYTVAAVSVEQPNSISNITVHPLASASNTHKEYAHNTMICRLKNLTKLFRRFASSESIGAKEGKSLESTSPFLLARKQDRPTAMLWLEVSRLRNGLYNWQHHLRNMIHHVDELNACEFICEKQPGDHSVHSSAKLNQFREAGFRIKERLQEIVGEYDENIKECTHIMDGMSLATQLELAHISRFDAKTNQEISRINLDVAQMSRRDGSLMKSIALLGMIFLPAGLVTAFFSMGYFDSPSDAPKESSFGNIGVYIISVVAFTLLTVGVFYIFVLRSFRGYGRQDAHNELFEV